MNAVRQSNMPTDFVAARWRFLAVAFIMLFLLILLIGKIATLQVVAGERGYNFLQTQAAARTIRNEEIPAYRGVITDRFGEPLAVSTPLMTLWINPSLLAQYPERHDQLAQALGMETKSLSDKINQYASKEFLYLRRKMTPADAAAILALKIPGLYSQTEYQRYYPAGEVAAHILGFTNIDDQGQEGLELGYNQWLSGQSGIQRVIKDLKGDVIEDLGIQQAVEPGKDVQLTIDMRLQYIAYKELKAGVAAHQASTGSLVILDAKTGDILAMASQPSYNPNNRSTITSENLRNQVLTDTFEPGSTMKPFTMVAALETGNFTPDTEINTHPGWMTVSGKLLKDPLNYGVLSLTRVIQKSSQIGTTRVALTLQRESLFDVFQRVELGNISEIGFPGEVAGYLPMPAKSDLGLATYSFGYGMSITAIQLARAYTAIANDGLLVEPRLIKGAETSAPKSVMSAEVARQIREMMVSVTEKGGTGTRAAVPNYRVAGKTGTAQLVGAEGYQRNRYRALFAGMIPAEDPRYVMVVVVGDPRTVEYGGGAVAAPIFGKVMTQWTRIVQMPFSPEKPVVAMQGGAQ